VSNICCYDTPKTVGDPGDVRAAVDETEYPHKSKTLHQNWRQHGTAGTIL